MRVLVTGAAGAIGSALARALQRSEPRASLLLTDVAPLEALAAELDGEVVVADLASPAGVEELVDQVGAVDVLVNCAGVEGVGSLASEEWASVSRLLQIDLLAPIRLMHAFAPGMVARGRGRIVNIASMAGVTPVPGMLSYCAAKAGLAMASEVARLELAPGGVDVVTVYPGPVRSPLERRAKAEMRQTFMTRFVPTGDPEPLVARIMAALERGRPRVIYPAFYNIGWGLPALGRELSARFSPGAAA